MWVYFFFLFVTLLLCWQINTYLLIELNQFEVDDQVTKTNKLKGITEITLNLDELDNSDNLKDGRPSNSLLTYYVTSNEDFTCFEPQNPQYNKLKNGQNLLP